MHCELRWSVEQHDLGGNIKAYYWEQLIDNCNIEQLIDKCVLIVHNKW